MDSVDTSTQLVNVLADKPVPFDFLVGGELIRLSLQNFLLSQNISAVSHPREGSHLDTWWNLLLTVCMLPRNRY